MKNITLFLSHREILNYLTDRVFRGRKLCEDCKNNCLVEILQNLKYFNSNC